MYGAARFGHHSAQFRVAQATEQGDEAGDDPDDEGQAHAHAAADEHIGTQVKDTGPHHDARQDVDTAEQAYFPFKFGVFRGELFQLLIDVLIFCHDGLTPFQSGIAYGRHHRDNKKGCIISMQPLEIWYPAVIIDSTSTRMSGSLATLIWQAQSILHAWKTASAVSPFPSFSECLLHWVLLSTAPLSTFFASIA